MKFLKIIRIHCSSFQSKLLLAFLAATLLPLSIIAGISWHISYGIAEDKILDSVLMSDEQLNAQLNSRLRQTETVADTIRYQMYSLSQTSEELYLSLDAISNVRNNISQYKSAFDFYHIFLFLPSGQIGADEGVYFFPLEKLSHFQLSQEELASFGSSSVWVLRRNVKLPAVLSACEADAVLCCRSLTDQGTGIMEYAYCIAIDAEEFSNQLNASFGSPEFASYLLSQDGQIIAHKDPSQNGTSMESSKRSLLLEHPDSFFHYKGTYYHNVSLENGWLHVTEIPDSYIASNTRPLIQSILLALTFFIPLTICVIILFSKSLTRRLTVLSNAMERFRLDQNQTKPSIITVPRPDNPEEYDEIDRLGITFEEMQNTISGSLKSIVDLSIREERLKYQLLQSQINPHFLYNILGSIKTCQTLGKLDIANQMITDLTAFYRLTLRKSRELIPIRDELEIARLYLNMEKLCHSRQLEWNITTEDGVENFMICKFTLQPFLENSIHHGLTANGKPLHIDVAVCYGDDTVIITIQDNGAGISPQTLAQLQNAMEHKIINYEKHFGISNVNARISNPLYGNGTVRVESQLMEGTCITIEFQQMEDTDEESYDR